MKMYRQGLYSCWGQEDPNKRQPDADKSNFTRSPQCHDKQNIYSYDVFPQSSHERRTVTVLYSETWPQFAPARQLFLPLLWEIAHKFPKVHLHFFCSMANPDISRLLSPLGIQSTSQNEVDYSDTMLGFSLSFPSITSEGFACEYIFNELGVFFSPHICVKSGLNRHANPHCFREC